jgi:hypothetical protein
VAYAEYELDAIMLTGSCTEFAPGKQLPPPKGLELHLGTEQDPHMVRVSMDCDIWQPKAWQVADTDLAAAVYSQPVCCPSTSVLGALTHGAVSTIAHPQYP